MPSPSPREKREAAAAAALLLLSRKATHTVALALLGAARSAPLAAPAGGQAEVSAAVGHAVDGAKFAARKVASEAFSFPPGEIGSSAAVSASLARQWAAVVEELASADGLDLAVAREKAATDLAWAAARTAKTEVFQAFNDAGKEAWFAARLEGRRSERVWSSMLEACPICAPLNGTVADSLGSFPYGDPQIHPGCLCVVFTRTT